MENEVMIDCKGDTFAEKKKDLLHQLGYKHVTVEMFEGMSEVQIENRVRTIISKPPKGYRY